MAETPSLLVSSVSDFIKANSEIFTPDAKAVYPELYPPWLAGVQGDWQSHIENCINRGFTNEVVSYLNSCLYIKDTKPVKKLQRLIPLLRESLSTQLWATRLLLIASKRSISSSNRLLSALHEARNFYQEVFNHIHEEETSPGFTPESLIGILPNAATYLAAELRSPSQSPSDYMRCYNLLYILLSLLNKSAFDPDFSPIGYLKTAIQGDLRNGDVYWPHLICLNEFEDAASSLTDVNLPRLLESVKTVQEFSCFNRCVFREYMLENGEIRELMLQKLHYFRFSNTFADVENYFLAKKDMREELFNRFAEWLLSSRMNSLDIAEFHDVLAWYIPDFKKGPFERQQDQSRSVEMLLNVLKQPVCFKALFQLFKDLALLAVRKQCGLKKFVDQFVVKLPNYTLDPVEKTELMILLILARRKKSLITCLKDYVSSLIDSIPDGTLEMTVIQSIVKRTIIFLPQLHTMVLEKQAALEQLAKTMWAGGYNMTTGVKFARITSFLREEYIVYPQEETDDLRKDVNKCIRMLAEKRFDQELEESLRKDYGTDQAAPTEVTKVEVLRRHLLYNMQKSGMSHFKRIIATSDQEAIEMYLSLFTTLKDSFAFKVLYNEGLPFCIPQFVVSQLRRLFQVTMPTTTICDSYFAACETSAIHMEIGGITGLDDQHKERAGLLMQSGVVQYTLSCFGLTSVHFEDWFDRIFFAPLVGLHGITVFGGTLLISNRYSGEEPYDLCGFYLTLFHESAHLLRKTAGDFYNEEVLTPTRDREESETYERGMPGETFISTILSGGEAYHGEGGYQLETSLFGLVITQLNTDQINYMIDLSNWNKDSAGFLRDLGRRGKTGDSKRHGYARMSSVQCFSRDNHNEQ